MSIRMFLIMPININIGVYNSEHQSKEGSFFLFVEYLYMSTRFSFYFYLFFSVFVVIKVVNSLLF